MKATVDAKTFSVALNSTMNAMKHSKIPILESVLLQFGGGKCAMTATDMDSWLTVEIPAQGDTFVCSFYQTRAAAKICRHYEGSLTIETEDSGEGRKQKRQIHLSCGSRSATLPGFLAAESEDFPRAPIMESGETFMIDSAASLLERVNRIKYAVRMDRDHMNATHTCVQFDRDKVFCVDGCRAACDAGPGFVVPRPFLIYPEVLAHLKLFGLEPVTVCVGERYVQFAGKGISLLCHRQGVVPFPLDQALPKECKEEFRVSPKEFLRELAYLKELLGDKRRPFLRLCGEVLSLESGSWSGCTTIHTEGVSTIEVGLNLHYMADALKQFEKEPYVKLKISGTSMPIMIEAEGRSDYALVQPVRMRETRAAA